MCQDPDCLGCTLRRALEGAESEQEISVLEKAMAAMAEDVLAKKMGELMTTCPIPMRAKRRALANVMQAGVRAGAFTLDELLADFRAILQLGIAEDATKKENMH
jgi:hypothetical protein